MIKNWYFLLHPKVVCLVTTINKKGQINAAPFTWITPLCDDPPILAFSPWYETHTFKNINATKEFVLNIVPEGLEKKIEICAKNWPEGVNELEKAGLNWCASKTVRPPRVNECLAWIECKVRKIVKQEGMYSLVIGDVLCVEKNENLKKRKLLHLGGMKYTYI